MNYVRITFADNGYVVHYDDPEVRRKNHEDKGPWEDPERTTVYQDDAALIEALPTILAAVQKYEKSSAGKSDAFNEAFTESTGN